MDGRDFPPLRSLPRVFLPEIDTAAESFELPRAEVEKFRKVLRLEEGSQIAVLPNDGSLIRCTFRARKAWPMSTEWPETEAKRRVTIIQALPKGDRLDTVLRMGTELGVQKFVVFSADRSVVRWDDSKRADKMRRYQAILCESAEQSFRCRLPELEFHPSLAEVLSAYPACLVLSELESERRVLEVGTGPLELVIGPEGGWAPREVELIGDRGRTLGPLVLRTDTAGVVAAALALHLPPKS